MITLSTLTNYEPMIIELITFVGVVLTTMEASDMGCHLVRLS
jgi:hypothetical protein